jgi:hypothetical protein
VAAAPLLRSRSSDGPRHIPVVPLRFSTRTHLSGTAEKFAISERVAAFGALRECNAST